MQEDQHRRMDTKSSGIRLPRVEKSTGKDLPIALTLRHVSLDDNGFCALSYTRGNDSPTFEVLVMDSTYPGLFHVRGNLYEFLHTASTSTQAWSNEWMWIDQICINQNDHTERCHQVNQMEKLYSTARATIVWPCCSSTIDHCSLKIDLNLSGPETLEASDVVKERLLYDYDSAPPARRLLYSHRWCIH
jgi:hypothetical protein